MRHKVTLRQELVAKVIVEADAQATEQELENLALAKIDDDEESFECTWAETTVGPPDDGPPIDGTSDDRWHAYAYSRRYGEK